MNLDLAAHAAKAAVLASLVLLVGCGGGGGDLRAPLAATAGSLSAGPTFSPMATPTTTPLAATPTTTPVVATPAATPTLGSTPTSAPTETPAPSPTSTPTAAPTQMATPPPTAKPTPLPTAKPTPAATPTPTPLPTSKATPTAVPSAAAVAGPSGPYAAFGDSITIGHGGGAPSTTPYPTLLTSASTKFVLSNLAVSGDTTRNQLSDALPNVPKGCGLATVDLGTNDISYIENGSYSLSSYESDTMMLLAGIRSACPGATIAISTIVLNAANSGSVGVQMNGFIKGLANVTVVDLDGDARLHDSSNFAPGFIHPTQNGQNILEADFAHALGM